MSITTVVLGAGASARMGQPKQLLRFRGEALVRRAARTALGAGLGPVVLVVGASAELVAAEVASLPIVIVPNPRWSDGMGSSIAAGVRRAPPDSRGVLIMLADQPLVDGALLRSLARLLTEFDAAACRYGGSLGVPAAFGPRLIDRLRTLPPEAGARAVLTRPGVRLAEVSFEDAALDIDTPEDFHKFSEMASRGSAGRAESNR